MILSWLRSKMAVTPQPQGGREFSSELEKFAGMIEGKQPFALSRFNDGEMTIIFGETFDVARNRIGNTYIPNQSDAEKQRALLLDAFRYRAPGYVVGIVCPCCEGDEKFYRFKEMSGQDETHLTWANVFVNSNFPLFKRRIEPLFIDRRIIFVGNDSADLSGLSFDVDKKIGIGDNAWIGDYEHTLHEITDYLDSENNHGFVFMFCAGVLSNLLIHKLYEKFPNNTYLDLGSVFDIELGLGESRRYLRKGKTLYKTCIWGNRRQLVI